MSVSVSKVSSKYMDKYVPLVSDIYNIAPVRMDDVYDFVDTDESCGLVKKLSIRHDVPEMVVMHWVLDSIYNKVQIV